MLAKYAGQRSVPEGDEVGGVVNAEMSRPHLPAMPGLGAQDVAELVQLLATAKLENRRLLAAAIPRLTKQELEKLMAESLPYSWMQTMGSGVVDICEERPSMGRARASKNNPDSGA
uniref:Uncharacterized protein n=1 Tax=Eutreptiella gymnastica TaxID=73025 RepID=A0A7S4G756_9EUGL